LRRFLGINIGTVNFNSKFQVLAWHWSRPKVLSQFHDWDPILKRLLGIKIGTVNFNSTIRVFAQHWFRPRVQELFDYWTFFLENSIKPKQNFKGKLRCPFDIVGKPSTSRILWRWNCILDLKCGRYKTLKKKFVGNSIKSPKLVLEVEINWVTSNHTCANGTSHINHNKNILGHSFAWI